MTVPTTPTTLPTTLDDLLDTPGLDPQGLLTSEHDASLVASLTAAPSPTSLHQRRMHLGRTANRAIGLGLVEDFIRTAGSPRRPQAAGYAIQVEGSWLRGSLATTQARLDALLAQG